MRIIVLVSVLAASFLACAAENVGTRDSAPVSELDTSERLADEPAGVAAAECVSEDTCARHGGGTDCVWLGDVDCGETFCRVPAEQCNAQPATFQRVEHVYVCSRPSGGECYQTYVGRYLVACGC